MGEFPGSRRNPYRNGALRGISCPLFRISNAYVNCEGIRSDSNDIHYNNVYTDYPELAGRALAWVP